MSEIGKSASDKRLSTYNTSFCLHGRSILVSAQPAGATLWRGGVHDRGSRGFCIPRNLPITQSFFSLSEGSRYALTLIDYRCYRGCAKYASKSHVLLTDGEREEEHVKKVLCSFWIPVCLRNISDRKTQLQKAHPKNLLHAKSASVSEGSF